MSSPALCMNKETWVQCGISIVWSLFATVIEYSKCSDACRLWSWSSSSNRVLSNDWFCSKAKPFLRTSCVRKVLEAAYLYIMFSLETVNCSEEKYEPMIMQYIYLVHAVSLELLWPTNSNDPIKNGNISIKCNKNCMCDIDACCWRNCFDLRVEHMPKSKIF